MNTNDALNCHQLANLALLLIDVHEDKDAKFIYDLTRYIIHFEACEGILEASQAMVLYYHAGTLARAELGDMGTASMTRAIWAMRRTRQQAKLFASLGQPSLYQVVRGADKALRVFEERLEHCRTKALVLGPGGVEEGLPAVSDFF